MSVKTINKFREHPFPTLPKGNSSPPKTGHPKWKGSSSKDLINYSFHCQETTSSKVLPVPLQAKFALLWRQLSRHRKPPPQWCPCKESTYILRESTPPSVSVIGEFCKLNLAWKLDPAWRITPRSK